MQNLVDSSFVFSFLVYQLYLWPIANLASDLSIQWTRYSCDGAGGQPSFLCEQEHVFDFMLAGRRYLRERDRHTAQTYARERLPGCPHGHIREHELPKIELENGRIYEHGKCWEDICNAILEAHHLIYMVGWSINHRVRLAREPTRLLPKAGELTLGDLLKYKS